MATINNRKNEIMASLNDPKTDLCPTIGAELLVDGAVCSNCGTLEGTSSPSSEVIIRTAVVNPNRFRKLSPSEGQPFTVTGENMSVLEVTGVKRFNEKFFGFWNESEKIFTLDHAGDWALMHDSAAWGNWHVCASLCSDRDMVSWYWSIVPRDSVEAEKVLWWNK